jgi:UDP-N-acetylglucosamine 4,6-dehydratase
LFLRLVKEGVDELPITDPRMTRFWITLKHGVEFVLSCLDIMHGGEIFVPKIPSMKVSDMASTLAPGIPHRIVGIRPGEKLHEVLVTVDEARTTVEMEDRYVIEPAFAWWDREKYINNGASPVAEGFSYTSDTNSDWLDPGSLGKLMSS